MHQFYCIEYLDILAPRSLQDELNCIIGSPHEKSDIYFMCLVIQHSQACLSSIPYTEKYLTLFAADQFKNSVTKQEVGFVIPKNLL